MLGSLLIDFEQLLAEKMTSTDERLMLLLFTPLFIKLKACLKKRKFIHQWESVNF